MILHWLHIKYGKQGPWVLDQLVAPSFQTCFKDFNPNLSLLLFDTYAGDLTT